MTIPRSDGPSAEKLDFLLLRAEQESIAAIRSIDARASERHHIMANAYSAQAVAMLGQLEGGCRRG